MRFPADSIMDNSRESLAKRAFEYAVTVLDFQPDLDGSIAQLPLWT